MTMDELCIAYPTKEVGMGTTENVKACAEKCGYSVLVLVKPTHNKRGKKIAKTRMTRVYIEKRGTDPSEFANFAADLGAMGLPAFNFHQPFKTEHHLTIFADTDSELDHAISVFNAHKLFPDAERHDAH